MTAMDRSSPAVILARRKRYEETMESLNVLQRGLILYMENYWLGRRHYPTYREMHRLLGFGTLASAYYTVRHLGELGLVTFDQYDINGQKSRRTRRYGLAYSPYDKAMDQLALTEFELAGYRDACAGCVTCLARRAAKP